MDIICVVECDKCGKSIIENPSQISFFVMDEILGVSICLQCGQPITAWINMDDARMISQKGVKTFSCETGEEVDLTI